jgi:hypothetical protein
MWHSSECPDKAYSQVFNASLKTSQALVTPAGSRDRATEHDQAEVIMALYQRESNNLSLVLKITLEDLSGDAIKHKQSDLSSQEIMRPRSQDSVQNHQRPPSSQHTRPLNKDLRPAGNEQEQSFFAAEMYDSDAGPQVKSVPGTSLSPENQHVAEKDSASHESPESPTNVNL